MVGVVGLMVDTVGTAIPEIVLVGIVVGELCIGSALAVTTQDAEMGRLVESHVVIGVGIGAVLLHE